ncbi:MAG: beta-ketoacyl-ACP synthase III [Desulfobacterales bacterium]|jgi:beta-ketodecanoyl-[acyl-carrier-protein] synthase|nr:beta-ketoacyl-ACP synthase III [Desulfobacteraceae bacterium]MBT4364290.1 beta-ketoacyl-ACP synthase III [Desulfobacteraceae bacterium]MBT7086907.1 beta-ketoacyl-ACP synthase III [Desulfobacterales bacterium]MBT7697510.1 beta-ketoacyl-ACP synthase III [Desulfobacterales bacterium]
MAGIVISGIGIYTPPEAITNEELVDSFNAYVKKFNEEHKNEIEAQKIEPLQESSAEFIAKASGVKNRYVMNKSGILDINRMYPDIPERPNEEMSIQCEMALPAIKEALDNAGKTSEDVDAVIVSCANMQRAYPAISIEIQDALGINGFAFDMLVACSSATFGMQTGIDSIKAGTAECVVMVSPDIMTGHVNFCDRDSHFIFGDACTAVVIEKKDTCKTDTAFEILGSKLQTKFSSNVRNNFGFLNRADESGIGKPDKLFKQNGRKVFKEVVPFVAEHITGHLDELNFKIEDMKRLWLHQANQNMNRLISTKVLGREPEPEETPIILDEYANTVSCGCLIAFKKYQDDFEIGEKGVISSFGAGYSVGSIIVEKIKI